MRQSQRCRGVRLGAWSRATSRSSSCRAFAIGDDLEPEALSYSDRETQAVVESLRGEFKVKLHQERLQELLEESF